MARADYALEMSGSSYRQIRVSRGYAFLSIVNGTDNKIEVYQAKVTDRNQAPLAFTVPLYTMMTLPILNSVDFTFIFTDGGSGGIKQAQVIFSDENLGIFGQIGSPSAGGNVSIVADGVGLARQNQLPGTLNNGALRVSIEANPADPTGVKVGSANVGVAGYTLPNQICKSALIQAANSNTDFVLVGDATSQEFELGKGMFIPVPVTNLNKIKVKAASGNQKVIWLWGE